MLRILSLPKLTLLLMRNRRWSGREYVDEVGILGQLKAHPQFVEIEKHAREMWLAAKSNGGTVYAPTYAETVSKKFGLSDDLKPQIVSLFVRFEGDSS